MHRKLALTSVLIMAFTLTACGGSNIRRDGPGSGRIPDLPGDAVPRQEARSKYGNKSVYEVFGKYYTVLASSSGYQERGVASWYGNKFHGKLTSSREHYDMYAMTAAHKTLPLPTYVRVRNLRNNRTVIVRVNDRGPFVGNRIIDLSYAAALKLDMVRNGTSLVEVTAISFEDPQSGDRPTRVVSAVAPQEARLFMQVGAFSERSNAARRLAALSRNGVQNAFIYEDKSSDPVLYRVRIGPVADVVQYDVLVEELENLGITDPYLISE